MNFGVNLYNWFLTNAQSLVLMAIVVIGIYLGFKREFTKLIGFLVGSLYSTRRASRMCCLPCLIRLLARNGWFRKWTGRFFMPA